MSYRETAAFHATAALTIVAALFATAGCAAPSQRLADSHDVDEQHGPKTLDDHARLKDLSIKAARLAKAKKTVPFETLSKQLARKQCTLALPALSKKQMTPAEIYRKRISGVLVVGGLGKCGKCNKWHMSTASGLVITPTGAIATNYHLFRRKTSKAFVAMTHDGKVFPVKEVLAASEPDDVTILQLDTGGAKLDASPLVPNTPVGTRVTVISHPNRRFYSLTTGTVSRYSKMRRKNAKESTTMMTITADFAKGSSGAPVFDENGNVAAMVSSTSWVYYTQTRDKQNNLQMVFKQCVPAASILKLVRRR